jgi:hypothetical protein
MAVAVAITAAPVMAVIRYAEDAFDRANGTTDAGTDRPTNHATDGSADAIALVGALFRPPHNALGSDQLRQRKPRQSEREDGKGCKGGGQSLRRTVGEGRRLSLGFRHFHSWRFGTDEPRVGTLKRRCGQMVAAL